MLCNVKGRIHSVETFGTVDGPGVRLVVFMQGCPMRCAYCHNPDTWTPNGGTEMTAEEILALYMKNKDFYRNGGITVSGGEPLMQATFLEQLFKLAKKQNIHTALDTSGICFSPENKHALDSLLAQTDLVLLDIKHIENAKHQALCGHQNTNILKFAEYLSEIQKAVWIRHVVVPGLTDNPESLFALGAFIGTLKNVRAVDILPYHTMGKEKYAQLNMEYSLKDLPPLSADELADAKKEVIRGIKSVLKN